MEAWIFETNPQLLSNEYGLPVDTGSVIGWQWTAQARPLPVWQAGVQGLENATPSTPTWEKKIKFKFSPNIKSSQISAKISTDSKERFCISLTVLMRKSSCWRTSSCFSFCRFSMAKRIASDIWSMLHRKSNNHIRLLLTFTCNKSCFFISFLRNIFWECELQQKFIKLFTDYITFPFLLRTLLLASQSSLCMCYQPWTSGLVTHWFPGPWSILISSWLQFL